MWGDVSAEWKACSLPVIEGKRETVGAPLLSVTERGQGPNQFLNTNLAGQPGSLACPGGEHS